jgi:hypothetical protein
MVRSEGRREMTDEATNFMERYIAAWNSHDGELIASVYDVNAQRKSPLGTLQGSDQIRAYAERLWHFAPDSHRSVPHWAAQGHVIYFELLYEGIQSGPLSAPHRELEISGQRFRMEGGGTLEIRDGRVVAERVYFDTAEFLRQLGLSL